ncbi:Arc family DNA-binding protein [Aeromonas dhakensis]|uniref:Arc family DNA-binding protein n=1 Tax=Aeromonas dhakensis TaxID=196024 RepID=UPI003EC90E6C|nr:Arc family DNA-binding protein [Aeromonas dhakensis]
MSQPKSYPLRMPDEMREQLQGLAEIYGRSLNAEIVNRLELSLMNQSQLPTLIDANRAKELAAAARQQLPMMIMDKVITEINHSISLGHSGAYVDLNEFELELLTDEHFEKIMEPVTSKLIAAGYTVEDLNSDSISIDF